MDSGFVKKCKTGAAGLSAVILCIIFTVCSFAFGKDVSNVRAAEDGGIPQPSSAKIYSSMSEDSDIIANLIVGNGFEVSGAESDAAGSIWYRVRTDFGADGYVKAGEMDRLIADAQAILPQSAAAANGEPPVPPDDSAGEQAEPGDTDGGEVPAEENNDDGEAPNPGEEAPADDNAGEAQEPPADDNAGEAQEPSDDNAGKEQLQADDNAGEAQEPSDDNAGEETAGGQTEIQGNETAPELQSVGGAGFGKVSDSQETGDANDTAADGVMTDSTVIGSEGFTVIERDNPKIRRHGGIDAVLIMIIAGGIICIIAIAALLRRAMKCVRTEV